MNHERWSGAARPPSSAVTPREVLGPSAYEQLLLYFEVALAGSNANFRSRSSIADGGPRDIEVLVHPRIRARRPGPGGVGRRYQ